MAELIASPEEVTREWLTEALQSSGLLGSVKSFEHRDIGTGQVGRCVRFELEVTGNLPSSVVGKFASDDPVSREAGVQRDCYSREVGFYSELAADLPIRRPACYFAAIDGRGPDHCLLLEDLAPAKQGDQLGGCSLAVAQEGVRQLAGLHAASWCRPGLEVFPWLGPTTSEAARHDLAQSHALRRHVTPGFVERYGDRLESDAIELVRRQTENVEKLDVACGLGLSQRSAEADDPPFSLVHGDFRLDNLLIDERDAAPTVAVVDWQTVRRGVPLSDLAYFLGASLTTEIRRQEEQSLFELYCSALSRRGVELPDHDLLWHEYRRGSFAGLSMAVIASMIVGQTERGDEMFLAMARRHARHVLDLGADALLA
ncbi:MAG: phosphotransferase [Acidobacteriota bacterium]